MSEVKITTSGGAAPSIGDIVGGSNGLRPYVEGISRGHITIFAKWSMNGGNRIAFAQICEGSKTSWGDSGEPANGQVVPLYRKDAQGGAGPKRRA